MISRASRAAVDSGWIAYPHQVGQTGKTVAPKAYIGFGISGSTQHTCGMKNSKLVINVNNMAENTFFETSDYGFVCDAGEVLDSLLKQTE